MKSMTRTEMIAFIKENHNINITHPLFTDDEYIFSEENGNIYDENRYLFEDWYSPNNCGIRIRTGGNWENGWHIK